MVTADVLAAEPVPVVEEPVPALPALVLLPVPLVLPVPVVPPVVVPLLEGATLAVAAEASFLNSARERVALAAVLFYKSVSIILWQDIYSGRGGLGTHFSLMTMTMPAWQCLPVAQ